MLSGARRCICGAGAAERARARRAAAAPPLLEGQPGAERSKMARLLLLAAACAAGAEVMALDNGAARTPVRGWSTWNVRVVPLAARLLQGPLHSATVDAAARAPASAIIRPSSLWLCAAIRRDFI